MSKVKLLALAAFAVFMLSVPATALAKEGGQWLVNGTPLAAGAVLELLPTALVLSRGHLVILTNPNLLLQCTGHLILLEGGKIIGPDGLLIKKVTFHQCEVKPIGAECKLENETIASNSIDGLASLDLPGSLNAYILLLPETKTTFATFKFEGEKCPLAGVLPLTGSISLLIHGALHETLLHLVLAFSLPKALKVGAVESHLLELDFDIALLQHENWSFH